MAWYQRIYFKLNIEILIYFFKKINFNNLIYIITISLFVYYYNRFYNSVKCYPFIKDVSFINKHFYGSHLIYSYKNVKGSIINDIFYKMLNYKNDNINFNIIGFRDVDGKKFLRYHPLSNYHLNLLEFSNINSNILVNIQFSTKNFNNCYLLSNETIFENVGYKFQYIANNFYFYEKKELIVKSINFDTVNYLNKHNDIIINHVKNIKNFHKLDNFNFKK